MTRIESQRKRVQERYSKAASNSSACCDVNYSEKELSEVPKEAVLGLGSGNPVRYADLKPGEVVLDLGSGGGVDVFLAARRVGPGGRVIGIDMTPQMVDKAQSIARQHAVSNVEFRRGYIEDLPLEDASVDAVLSNCVINLSPSKATVFREAFRVLKPDGRLVISDIVQERPLDMDDDCGCVANAALRGEYLEMVRGAGFSDLELVEDTPISFSELGSDASAITLRARKPIS